MSKMSAQDWIAEIDRALEYRQVFGREVAWRKNELNYLNVPGGHTSIGPNLVHSMGDTMLGSLASFDPEFIVEATHPRGVERAPIVEATDNFLCKKLKLRRQVGRAILGAFLTSRAILKIGYDSEFGWSPRFDIGSVRDPVGMTLTQFHPKKGHRIENLDVRPGMPWVLSVPSQDVVVPWGTVEAEASPWIAHRFIRLNEDLKADIKYKNTARLQPSMSIEDFVHSYINVGSDIRKYRERRTAYSVKAIPRAIYNELWEIHDRRDMTVKVVARDFDKYLRDELDAIALVCNTPFVTGTFVEHPRAFWSTPLAYYLGQIQATQYDVSKQEEKQRRISNLKFIAAARFMSRERLDRLISGDVGAVEIAEVTEGLKDKLVPFPQGQFLNFMLQKDACRRDALEAIGYSRNQMGEYDLSSRRTAREASFVQAGSQRREGMRIAMVKDLYIDTIEKLNKVCFSFWRLPRYIMKDREWVQFTGEEIEGDYLYDLSLSAKREISKAERRVEGLMLAVQIAQLMPTVDIESLSEFLANAAGDVSFEKLINFARGRRQSTPAARGELPTIPATKSEGETRATV